MLHIFIHTLFRIPTSNFERPIFNLNNFKIHFQFPLPICFPRPYNAQFFPFHIVSCSVISFIFDSMAKLWLIHHVGEKPNLMLFSLFSVQKKKEIIFISADVFEILQLDMVKIFVQNATHSVFVNKLRSVRAARPLCAFTEMQIIIIINTNVCGVWCRNGNGKTETIKIERWR